MAADEHACPVTQQIIDIELEDRSAPEIAGAYHALCCMILTRTAQIVGKSCKDLRDRKAEVFQKRDAERWVNGRVGVLTFESVCEAFDMDPERARSSIERYAQSAGDGAITKRKQLRRHVVFGRTSDACRRPKPVRETSPHC